MLLDDSLVSTSPTRTIRGSTLHSKTGPSTSSASAGCRNMLNWRHSAGSFARPILRSGYCTCIATRRASSSVGTRSVAGCRATKRFLSDSGDARSSEPMEGDQPRPPARARHSVRAEKERRRDRLPRKDSVNAALVVLRPDPQFRTRTSETPTIASLSLGPSLTGRRTQSSSHAGLTSSTSMLTSTTATTFASTGSR